MKATKEEMELFAKIISPDIETIQGTITQMRLLKEDLDFASIQDAIYHMATMLSEFYDPRSDNDGNDDSGGFRSKLIKPTPTKGPSNANPIPKEENVCN